MLLAAVFAPTAGGKKQGRTTATVPHRTIFFAVGEGLRG